MGWSLARPIASRATTISSVPGLADALAGKLGSSSTVDGGTYEGVTAVAGGITITAEPQSVTTSSFGVSVTSAVVPSPPQARTDAHWEPRVEFAGGKFFLTSRPSNQPENGQIAASDNGLSWSIASTPGGANEYLSIASSGSSYAAITSYGDKAIVSSNGTSWTTPSGFPSYPNGAFNHRVFFGGGAMFVQQRTSTGGTAPTYGRRLWRSTNGTSWTSVDLPAQSGVGGWYNGNFLGALDGMYEANGRLYATFRGDLQSGTNAIPSGLFYSTNGGTSWASVGNIDGFSGSPAQSQATFGPVVYSLGQYHCASGLRWFASTNGNASTWQVVRNLSQQPFAVAGNDNSLLYMDSSSSPLYCYGGGCAGSITGGWGQMSIPGLPLSSGGGGLVRLGSRIVVYRQSDKIAVSTTGESWQVVQLPYTLNAFSRPPAVSTDAIVFPVLSGGVLARTMRLSFTEGASATFIVAALATGGVPVAYQWQSANAGSSAWNDINLANSATLTLTGVTSADNGKRYRCIVSASGYTSATSAPATLTVT